MLIIFKSKKCLFSVSVCLSVCLCSVCIIKKESDKDEKLTVRVDSYHLSSVGFRRESHCCCFFRFLFFLAFISYFLS
ncbi:hypothetical protein BY996DRAFT_6911289 [Phakopsora pachyrhizi]|nr:hypothetical protein BY996DRAFT_6911289 [Phakopsora pachyrhizi]